jgi:membrane protease subunit HflK
MAWNEPGGSGNKDKDPWGNRPGDQGPPDLDEVIKKLQGKLGGLFGGRGGGGGGGRSPSGISGSLISTIVVIALIIWGLTGIYIVDSPERGVVLRFGKFVETTGPGPHWHIPYPIESVEKVNVDNVRATSHSALMLTKDENLISISMGVQYRVKSAEDYLFQVREPDYTLKEATESALREVVGSKKLDDIFSQTGGREVLVQETEKKVQALLDRYQAGLHVIKVNLENAQPPEQVQAAFEDAIKAREDEDRLKKQAEGYELDIIPKAEGDAQRIVQEAEAYKQRVTADAEGQTSRFLQTLTEYKKAPQVTSKRMYLETLEQIYSKTNKVMVDVNKSNNLLYLPLDKMVGQGMVPPELLGSKDSSGSSSGSSSSSSSGSDRSRDRSRARELR